MCYKNFCVQAKGGGIAQWPPLNTPLHVGPYMQQS